MNSVQVGVSVGHGLVASSGDDIVSSGIASGGKGEVSDSFRDIANSVDRSASGSASGSTSGSTSGSAKGLRGSSGDASVEGANKLLDGEMVIDQAVVDELMVHLESLGIDLESMIEESETYGELYASIMDVLGEDFDFNEFVEETGQLGLLEFIERLGQLSDEPIQLPSGPADKASGLITNVLSSVSSSLVAASASARIPVMGGAADLGVQAPVNPSSAVQISSDLTADLKSLVISSTHNSSTSVQGQQSPQFTAQVSQSDMSSRELLAQRLMAILGDKISVQAAARKSDSVATIRLDPPDLGRMDVKLRVDGERLIVQLSATNQATRDALQDTTDRLKSALVGSYDQVDVDVNSGSQDLNSSSDGDENSSIGSNQVIIGEESFVEPLVEDVLARV